MTTKLQDELITKWVAALRSDEYAQARSVLKSTSMDGCIVGYCCLGVAGELAGVDLENIVEADAYNEIKDIYGLQNNMGAYEENALYLLNDTQRKTFKEIADIIESRPAGLFVE